MVALAFQFVYFAGMKDSMFGLLNFKERPSENKLIQK